MIKAFYKSSRFDSFRGSSIVGAIVFVGATIGAGVLVLQMVATSKRVQLVAEKKTEQIQLRNYIRENFDCNDALATINSDSSICSTGKYFSVMKPSGKILATSDQKTKIGEHRVRVSCDPTTENVMVETMRVRSDGNDEPWMDPFDGIPPISKGAGMSAYLNFESVPNASDGKTVDSTMNDYFESSYGVRFNYVGGSSMRLSRIVSQNGAKVNFKAWASVKCPGKPNNNRVCGGSEVEKGAGNYAISSSNAKSSKDISFEVIYSKPATNPSFDMYDFDGGETWTITAFDEHGNEVGKSVYDANKGYSTKGTSNSDVLVGGVKGEKIRRLHFVGKKGIKIFGFGFDNFKTGLSTCVMDL